MMRKPVHSQPHLQEPPPDSPGSPPLDSGESSGSRAPIYQTPVITYALIAVNVALWLLTVLLTPGGWQDRLVKPSDTALLLLGAKYGPYIHRGEYWRLVTATFLHAGLLHLAANMWALLQLGTLCEIVYGRARFLILYVCSGVMGSIASYELSQALGVGASGAIFGLFGAAVVFSLKYRRELPGGMGDRLLRSLIPVLLLNLALTFAIPVIDKSAHLGGLITGALLASLTESRTASAERRQREILPVPAALLTAIGLLCYGAWGLARVAPAAVQSRMASLKLERRDPDAAIQLLQKAAARRPHDVAARLALFLLLKQRNRWPEVVQEFLALSREPLPPQELIEEGLPLAAHLSELHRGPEAEAVYRRLLELDPEDFRLLNGLAWVYADVLGTHLDEAERLADKALEAVPNDAGVVDTLAWVYLKRGKVNDAYTTQQRAVQLAGNVADIRYHMGAIEEAMGHLPAAREEYEMALRQDPRMAEARQALKRLESRAPGPAPPPSPGRVTGAATRTPG